MSERKTSFCKRLIYSPLSLFLTVVGRLPLSVIWPLGDFTGWLARRVVRYRLPLVRRNIADCFPEKTPEERCEIEKDFYRRLGRYVVETPRMRYMKPAEMKRRMVFENMEEVEALGRAGKSIAFYTSHFGNWEWSSSFRLALSDPECVTAFIYRPLKDSWFDCYFFRLRSRFGVPVKQKSALRQLLTWRREKKTAYIGFLSDQKPGKRTSSHTVDFFGRPTPFIAGTEELASRLGLAVGYFDMECEGKGRYRCTLRILTDDASKLPPGELTERYAKMLETTIRRTPGAYLWSHNKWRIPKKELKNS